MSEPDPWEPGSPGNRARTRESIRQVRRLLMEWDPIGVSGITGAADEYDCMIGALMHQLFDGAGARSLADWISHERVSHFGLPLDTASDMQLAKTLTTWWVKRRGTTTRWAHGPKAAEAIAHAHAGYALNIRPSPTCLVVVGLPTVPRTLDNSAPSRSGRADDRGRGSVPAGQI